MKARSLIYFLGLVFFSPMLKAEAVSIQASCTPNPLTAKSLATYTIVIKGSSQASAPVFPPIRGLDIQFLGKGHSVKIMNGQKWSELRLNYAIKAHTPGTYTLPSLNLQVDHKTYQLPPLDLTVLPSSEHALLKNSGISLSLQLEPASFYLGQSFTGKLVLRVPAGIQGSILSDRPELISPGFCELPALHPPQDNQKQENGQLFQEITWNLRIQCTQAGKHSLSYQLPLSLRVQSSKQALQSFFDDDLLGPLAIFQAQDEEVLLQSQETSITVLDLPQEGRPAGFSGYIGTLRAQKVETSLMDPEVGDPVTVKVILTGSGDLQALPAPILAQDKRIKAYPPKEEVLYQGAPEGSVQKSLEYILIPQEAGNLHLPPLDIDFFNPETKRYERLCCSIPPLRVQAPKMPYQAPQTEPVTVELPQEKPALEGDKAALPLPKLQAQLGTLRPSILPSLWHSRLYWLGQGTGLLMIVGALTVRRFSQLRKQKALSKQSSKELDILLKKAREAALAHQEAEFFKHLHDLLCLPCLQLGLVPSLKSLEGFLIQRGATPEALSSARHLWDLREGYTFGGGLGSNVQLKAIYKDLATFANHLKPCLP